MSTSTMLARTAALLLGSACASALCAGGHHRSAQAAAPIPLEPMRMLDAEATDTSGTGCVWSDRRGSTWRMSMRDDRAAVRRGGVHVLLKPAPGAVDLFPFTYDRWIGGGMTIRITKFGPARRVGSEISVAPAWLRIEEAGRTQAWSGVLACGS